jgi:hypothetical protein
MGQQHKQQRSKENELQFIFINMHKGNLLISLSAECTLFKVSDAHLLNLTCCRKIHFCRAIKNGP